MQTDYRVTELTSPIHKRSRSLNLGSPADLLDTFRSRDFRLATRLEIAHTSFASLDVSIVALATISKLIPMANETHPVHSTATQPTPLQTEQEEGLAEHPETESLAQSAWVFYTLLAFAFEEERWGDRGTYTAERAVAGVS
jgi:hypothetical protein